MTKDKKNDVNPEDTLYNNSNVLKFIEALSPLPSASEQKVKSQIVASMYPELFVEMEKPLKPTSFTPLVDEETLVLKLSDSANSYSDESDMQLDKDLLEEHYFAKKAYDFECESYREKEREYEEFQSKKKKLFVAAKKYMEGTIGWGVILDYYRTSTYLKYIIQTQAVLIDRYLKKDIKKDNSHIKNFKKAVPQMVEFYLLFGKCSICFSKVVKDEIEVMDPLQIINTQMLLPATVSHTFFGERAYETYRNLGWRDWDPVNYVDVMQIPSLQSSSEEYGVLSPTDIRKQYTALSNAFPLSHRFNMEQTIPVVGRKAIMQEKMSLLGGDATFVADNLWLLATLELLQNIMKITSKNLNALHIKDPSLGLDSAFENNYDVDRDTLQKDIEDVTDEGNMGMYTTSGNTELRAITLPADHLQEMYDRMLRQLMSKMGMDSPEQTSSTQKGVKKSSYTQEYWIENVGTFVFEKYCKMLCFLGKMSESDRDYWLEEGVFSKYPRIDLRDPDEINGQKAIFDSLAVAGKATIQSKKLLAEQLFGLSITFEETKKKEESGFPKNGNKTSSSGATKTNSSKKGDK